MNEKLIRELAWASLALGFCRIANMKAKQCLNMEAACIVMSSLAILACLAILLMGYPFPWLVLGCSWLSTGMGLVVGRLGTARHIAIGRACIGLCDKWHQHGFPAIDADTDRFSEMLRVEMGIRP